MEVEKKELERRKKEAAAGTVEFKDVTSEEYDNFVRTYITNNLTKRLYDLVPEIRTHFSTEPFPSLPGSHFYT